MMIRLVQVYGQIRLGKLVGTPLGLLVTLSIQKSADGALVVLAAPYRTGDENEPNHTIVKLCDSRLTVPIKLRRTVGMERYVELLPQGGGQVVIRPCTDADI